MIYLDHNATTPLHPSVLEKMKGLLIKNVSMNPSSIHSYGRTAKGMIENARKSIASLLGFFGNFTDYQIVFTSTGTEANNLVLSNFQDGEIFISAIEHPSIWSHSKFNSNIKIIKVNEDGILDLEDLKGKLQSSKSSKKLVSVMLANNETGIIQPMQKIVEIVHNNGAVMHSDLVQAAGKIDVDITEMNIDFCTISAHKFGGPLGAACLITKTSLPLKAMIVGGGQERNIRSGTENVPAIIGFGEAANIAKEEIDLRLAHMIKLRNYLESELLKTYDDIEIIGINTNRLPNTTMIVKEGRNSDTTIIALDLKGVAVSSGAACSSGKIEPSHVLSAMGLNDDKKNSALRISLGYNTTQDDIDGFLKIYNEINNK